MHKVNLYYHDKQVRSLWSGKDIKRGEIRQFILNFKDSVKTFDEKYVTLRFFTDMKHTKTVTNIKDYL